MTPPSSAAGIPSDEQSPTGSVTEADPAGSGHQTDPKANGGEGAGDPESTAGNYCGNPTYNQAYINSLRECDNQMRQALERCDSSDIQAVVGFQSHMVNEGAYGTDFGERKQVTADAQAMVEEKRRGCDSITRSCYATCKKTRELAAEGQCQTKGYETTLYSCEKGEVYAKWFDLTGASHGANSLKDSTASQSQFLHSGGGSGADSVATSDLASQATQDLDRMNAGGSGAFAQQNPDQPNDGGLALAQQTGDYSQVDCSMVSDSGAGRVINSGGVCDRQGRNLFGGSFDQGSSYQVASNGNVPLGEKKLEYMELREMPVSDLDRLEADRRKVIKRYEGDLATQNSMADSAINNTSKSDRNSYWRLTNSGNGSMAAKRFPKLHEAYQTKKTARVEMARDPGYIRAQEELYLIDRARPQPKGLYQGSGTETRQPAFDKNMCFCTLADSMSSCEARLYKNGCM